MLLFIGDFLSVREGGTWAAGCPSGNGAVSSGRLIKPFPHGGFIGAAQAVSLSGLASRGAASGLVQRVGSPPTDPACPRLILVAAK